MATGLGLVGLSPEDEALLVEALRESEGLTGIRLHGQASIAAEPTEQGASLAAEPPARRPTTSLFERADIDRQADLQTAMCRWTAAVVWQVRARLASALLERTAMGLAESRRRPVLAASLRGWRAAQEAQRGWALHCGLMRVELRLRLKRRAGRLTLLPHASQPATPRAPDCNPRHHRRPSLHCACTLPPLRLHSPTCLGCDSTRPGTRRSRCSSHRSRRGLSPPPCGCGRRNAAGVSKRRAACNHA